MAGQNNKQLQDLMASDDANSSGKEKLRLYEEVLVQILSGVNELDSKHPETYRRLYKVMNRWREASPNFRRTDKPCQDFETVLKYCRDPRISEFKVVCSTMTTTVEHADLSNKDIGPSGAIQVALALPNCRQVSHKPLSGSTFFA